MSSRKKGTVLILLSLILMVLFIAWQQKKKKKQPEPAVIAVQTMVPMPEMSSVQDSVMPDAAALSSSPEASLEPEEHGEEEAYPLVMNVSALPERSLREMKISQEEAAERIRIFANAQGYAGVDQVFYAGETRFDDSNQSVTMDLYFEPEGEKTFYFSFIYYQESGEYVLAPW